jgi:phytanoyl-CoA hydroxylase
MSVGLRRFGSLAFPVSDKFKNTLTPEVLSEKAKEFDKDGFTVFHNFYDHETVDKLREEMDSIISKAEKEGLNENAVFTTNKQIEYLSKSVDYFLDSASKISFFYEKDAFDEQGKLTGKLNNVLNKVGHAMHDLNKVFYDFCYSNEVKNLSKHILNFTNPVLVQTMYIFKSPRVGGEVNPHQDSTYIISNPLSCKAIWVALDDANKENG